MPAAAALPLPFFWMLTEVKAILFLLSEGISAPQAAIELTQWLPIGRTRQQPR
jgi:hypothetical protein